MGAKGADARRLFVRISPLHLPRASQAFPNPSFFSPRGVVGASWRELLSQIFSRSSLPFPVFLPSIKVKRCKKTEKLHVFFVRDRGFSYFCSIKPVP